MKLKNILKGIDATFDKSLENTQVTGISIDSRLTKKGNLFVALEGTHTDGINFVDEALKNKASACVVNSKTIREFSTKEKIIYVPDTKKALAQLSSNFYLNPTRDILLIGVTGTNGKTTITYMLEAIFKKENKKVGVIGTINYRYENKVIPAVNTTPFAHTLMKIFLNMRKKKVEVVAMEASSHALDQKRVDGCEFDCAIFTNLTPEHLDYHKTMENYFAAKARLFKEVLPQSSKRDKFCVIGIDDEWGEKLAQETTELGIKTIRVSLSKSTDVFAKSIEMRPSGTKFVCKLFDKTDEFAINLIGKYNVSNALLAIATAYSLGVSVSTIKKGLLSIKKIPGRLETIRSPKGFTVVIDYAHTPDALLKVLSTLKELKPKRVITVFGCGGDRDRTKRPLMGEIAATMSDFVIVTSDNPRTEDPYKIMLDIEIGIKKIGTQNYKMILERREAISHALKIASESDIILVAGKGHENYQIIGTEKLSFSDYKVVKEILNTEND